MSWRESGEGRTVLFLHGFPFDSRLWERQLADLPEGWRGIAPDLRGFGESEGSADPQYTMDMLADDAAALLGHLGVRRAVICGQSMGGYVAFAMHRRHRALFGGVVLAATRATPDSPEGRRTRLQLAERVRTEGIAPVLESMLPRLFSPATERERPQVIERVRAMMQSVQPATMMRAMAGMAARPSAEDELRNIVVPTVVIVGADDAVTDRGSTQLMARGIRGALFETIPGAGHVAPLEAPQAFNAALRRFLTALP